MYMLLCAVDINLRPINCSTTVILEVEFGHVVACTTHNRRSYSDFGYEIVRRHEKIILILIAMYIDF